MGFNGKSDLIGCFPKLKDFEGVLKDLHFDSQDINYK